MDRSFARIRFGSRILMAGWYLTAVVTWGGLIASLPGYYRWFVEQPIQRNFNLQQTFLTIITGLASLACAVISLGLATLIFVRKRDDHAALYVSFYLLIYGFLMAGPMETLETYLLQQSSLFSFRMQAVIFGPIGIFLLLIFPNGKITPRWMRWLIPLILVIPVVMLLLPQDQILSSASSASLYAYIYTGSLFLIALGGPVYRYLRKSGPVERQQTKIVLYGIFIQFLFLAISSSMYFQLTAEEQFSLNPETLFSSLFWFISLLIVPVALTLSVIRSHLWEIDVVIRRTLIYGFLTATLALLYFGSVVLMQYGFRLMIGHESSLAVVITTLSIAGLVTPLRRRIQSAIDRRFYRSKYNSEQALASFQRHLRERVDLNQVEKELTDIVQVTVQPEWMVFWVRTPGPRKQ